MPRKYSFADVNTEEKPLITRQERQFGPVLYTWRCVGRGSAGFGTTPEHAYARWHGNWQRRFRFYATRERYSADVLQLHTQARAPEQSVKTKVCSRCGTPDLHWGSTEQGWRLFDTENYMHRCHQKVQQ